MKWLPVSLLFFISCITNIYAKDVTFTVLYESLCPDSIDFIKDQFYPTYSSLKEKFNVEFVPFGKANATKKDGKWTFDCQHKENECYGNKVQSCAINLAPKNVSTEFVVCAMKSGNASNNVTLQKCAMDVKLSWKSIEDCINSGKGDELLAKNGDRTNALRPNIPFIPTILYNNVYKDVVQKLALKHFRDLTELLIEVAANTSGSQKISCFSSLALILSVTTIFKLFS